MNLSLEQTQELLAILDSDDITSDLEEFIVLYGYDESDEDDLTYAVETITYQHRKIVG
jgi:hypothetical protein